MLKVLEPLHEMLEEGVMRYKTTIEAYRHELVEAWDCCMNNKRTLKEAELTQTWDLYYHVFKKVDRQIQAMTTLDLKCASPDLLECRDLELAVPGTYQADNIFVFMKRIASHELTKFELCLPDAPVVTIMSFAPQLAIIQPKQCPGKLTILGSDGKDYAFC